MLCEVDNEYFINEFIVTILIDTMYPLPTLWKWLAQSVKGLSTMLLFLESNKLIPLDSTKTIEWAKMR